MAKELQRHLAGIIRSKGMASWDGALVSVSGVTISPDLAVAKVYVSIFPSAKQEKVFRMIQESGRTMRGELGRQMAKQLRIIPELIFYLDDSLDYVEHIDELLAK